MVGDEEPALLGRVADLDGGRGRRQPRVHPVAQLGHLDVRPDPGLTQLGYRHLLRRMGKASIAPLPVAKCLLFDWNEITHDLINRGALIKYGPWLLAFRSSPLPPAAPETRVCVLT